MKNMSTKWAASAAIEAAQARLVCKKCGAEIIWSRTINDKPMPIDLEPVYGGNIVLGCHGALARVVKPEKDIKRFRSHFATCPYANEFRGQK